MKKLFALLLAVLPILSTVACGQEAQPTVTTTVETEEPEVFASIDLIKNGVSDFVLVHDGSSAAMGLAMELVTHFSRTYGITLSTMNASQAEEGTPQILIGNTGKSGERAMKKLTGEFDFTLRVEENKLVLCAKNDLSYSFLKEYLKREVFVKTESVDMTLDSDNDNILYSQSPLMEKTFVDYWMAENSYFPYTEHFSFEIFQNADTKLPYRIYVPFNYDPAKEYPLLLNLHGAGLRGDNNERQLNFIDEAMKNPELTVDEAIIIFPQCPENQKWVDANWSLGSYNLNTVPESNELKAVMELLGQLQQKYSIDAKRIYAMGFSMGGYGTWNLLMNHPDVFAAGIPMCGAGDPNQANILKDMPIWAVHGALDPTVPVSGSRDMVEALEAVGAANFHYTELPDAEHDVWNYTYKNTEMFQWLFNQFK